jgi:UDP-2,3-diacylglucosamine pyrophosphatase LpxH
MSISKRLTNIFQSSEKLTFNNESKIVLISDCHRGDGSWGDNFSNNQQLYFAAMTDYYRKNFTYIELGDGDELWENRKLDTIKTMHSDAFWIMSKFYKKGRLYMLYGNHDMVKKNSNYAKSKLSTYYDEATKKYVPLFPRIRLHEGLVLVHKETGHKIFLTHGHQADYLNYDLWKLARFMVRYMWRPLELLGLHDPTSAAKNNTKKIAVEVKLIDWSVKNNQMLIAGHTHKPVFPDVGEPLYFNDGSCVHPRCITAIEIENGQISLVKWTLKTKKDGTLYVGKEVLEGPVKLLDFFGESVNEIK